MIKDVETAQRDRRRFFRHKSPETEVVIGRNTYEVCDWSLSGISFLIPATGIDLPPQIYNVPHEPELRAGDVVTLTLLFHFPNETVSIGLRARILRRSPRMAAAVFTSLPVEAHRLLERAIDDANTEEFVGSQT